MSIDAEHYVGARSVFSCSFNTLVLWHIFEDLLGVWSRARCGGMEEQRLGRIRTLWEHLVCLSDQGAATGYIHPGEDQRG